MQVEVVRHAHGAEQRDEHEQRTIVRDDGNDESLNHLPNGWLHEPQLYDVAEAQARDDATEEHLKRPNAMRAQHEQKHG